MGDTDLLTELSGLDRMEQDSPATPPGPEEEGERRGSSWRDFRDRFS
jgi:hypothetical protein